MATKTISIELDAYEKLRRAKHGSESFSAVIRRAQWPDAPCTGGDWLRHLQKRMGRASGLPDEEVLDALDRAQEQPRRSSAHGR